MRGSHRSARKQNFVKGSVFREVSRAYQSEKRGETLKLQLTGTYKP